MGDYERSTTVAVPPARLFAYLSDVTNLPAFLPQMTQAHSIGDGKVDVTARIQPEGEPEREVEGEAWIKVKEAGRTLQWGASGPHDYHGELDVDAGTTADTSTLVVRLHTEHVEGDELDRGLDRTLEGIRSAVERVDGG